jgi:hypothetical protein
MKHINKKKIPFEGDFRFRTEDIFEWKAASFAGVDWIRISGRPRFHGVFCFGLCLMRTSSKLLSARDHGLDL